MVTIVADNIVVLADYHCQHALIDGEARGEAQAVILADELRDLLFELHVQVERSIEEAASCAARAVLVECCLSRIDDALVTRQARIGV